MPLVLQHHRDLLLLLLLLLLLPLLDLSASEKPTKHEYLKLPLRHKTPTLSPTHILSLDLHRLSHYHHHRHHHQHKALKSPVVSGAPAGSGQYFVNLSIGNPPQSLLLVADTGSDLLWLKCSACRPTTPHMQDNCSSVHPPGTEFLFRRSSTFSPIHCFDSACQLVPHPNRTRCTHSRLHSPCHYEYQYGDGSVTSGFFSRETASFNTSSGKQSKRKGLLFGCGFRISGPSVSRSSFNGAHGVMGLGRGPISLPSQLGRVFGNKFSYCLMDYTLSPPPTSYLTIGGGSSQNDGVLTNQMRFTPLVANPLAPTFYYVEIKSVFVANRKLTIDPSVWSLDEFGNGGTVVDSGTTLTFVADSAYRQILTAVKRQVQESGFPRLAESIQGFDLCLNVSGLSKPSLPKLSFELGGGAVFAPPKRNYFIETEEGVKCLAIQPVESGTGFSVIGNLMQQGFLFDFDRDSSRLGFSRHGCAIR